MNLDTRRTSLIIALIVAWTATLGSLYFSEIRHFIPCTLCWYQRILMYPLSIILLVGIIRRDQGIAYYVLPFSSVGILVSTYHYLIQKTDLFSESTACVSGVPCTATGITWLGIVTIPSPRIGQQNNGRQRRRTRPDWLSRHSFSVPGRSAC